MIKKIMAVIKDNWQLFGLAFAIIYSIYAVELNNATTLDHMWDFNGVDYILEDGKFPKVQLPSLSINSILNYFLGGRSSVVITNFIWWFLGLFGISIYTRQFVPKFLMMICLALSATVITRLFDKHTKNEKTKYVILILALISFINPLFIEVWSYTALEWTIGILCGVVAALLFAKKHYVWSGFLVWLSVGFYECYFENFLILCTAYIYLKYKNTIKKDTFIAYFKMLLTGGIPVAINLICQKGSAIILSWMETAKNATAGVASEDVVQSSSSIKANIMFNDIPNRIYNYGVVYFTHIVGDVFGYYPKYFLYAILLIMFITTSCIICKRYGFIAELHFILFFVFEIIWFLIVFIGTMYWIEARIAWNVFMAISMMFIVFLVHSEFADKQHVLHLFFLTLIIFSIVNIYTTNSKTTDYYIARASDHQYLDCVQAEIDRYEESTGNKVTKIYTLIRYDITQQSQYLLLQANVNAYDRRLVSKDWSDVEALNYYEGENYISLPMTGEDYITYFADKKRYAQFVPEEQLVFVDDALYWDIY
ncbi:glucosyltransferase domain-containing protein [Butyrivibrio fibrisolvens]|uniref:glucosyltransferase domain-containing protein n=1 Tax=Butyrivibrio fibrisolvens TaxID=831 RepID=UPI000416AED5|nr:glucosyltransferase domain-containing protein [Butyrivibrio fibrisolvens]